jgi:hypothetical protein
MSSSSAESAGAESPFAGRLSRPRWVTRRMITSMHKLQLPDAPEWGRPGKSGASASPTETPQLRDTAADPHRNPTDETAHSGTLVMRVKGTENSRSSASMRVSWAAGAFPGKCSQDDRAPEKEKVGGSYRFSSSFNLGVDLLFTGESGYCPLRGRGGHDDGPLASMIQGWARLVTDRDVPVFGGGSWFRWSQRMADGPVCPGRHRLRLRRGGLLSGSQGRGWLVRRVRAGRTAGASRSGTPPSRARCG